VHVYVKLLANKRWTLPS